MSPGQIAPGDLLPDGAKVRGVNLAIDAADANFGPLTVPDPFPGGSTVYYGWANSWLNFDATTWDNWIRPNLDLAVTAGANVVRVFGSARLITEDHMTWADYEAKWAQIVSYCSSLGLKVYPCACHDSEQYGGAAQYDTAFLDYQVAFAQMMEGFGAHIIGIDVYNETQLDRTYFQPAIQAVTTLPLTNSIIGFVDSVGYPDWDFVDMHYYGGPVDDPANLYAYYWYNGYTKPIMFGEFGGESPELEADIIARYDTVAACCSYVGPGGQRMAGAVQWVIRDYDVQGASSHYGMFTHDGLTERTDRTASFQTIPLV